MKTSVDVIQCGNIDTLQDPCDDVVKNDVMIIPTSGPVGRKFSQLCVGKCESVVVSRIISWKQPHSWILGTAERVRVNT